MKNLKRRFNQCSTNVIMFNEKMEDARNYNKIGSIRDSYTLKEKKKHKMRLEETGRYGVRFPDYKYVMKCYSYIRNNKLRTDRA